MKLTFALNSITYISMSTLFCTLLSKQSTRAFTPTKTTTKKSLSVFFRNHQHDVASSSLTRSTSSPTARYLSSEPPPMPYGDDLMPFYALGTNIALQVGGQGNFKTMLNEDEMDIVLEAFCATMKQETPIDAQTILRTYGQELNQVLVERTNRIVDRVKAEGAEFITNFLDCTEEATKTESGMVYYEMVPGTGKQPTIQSSVEVHYHGTLTDGTVFDSSVDRGETISFPLGGVIQGWQEGLQLMKEGGKATLVIPSELAYGDEGSGQVIPPGATLKFEVELFKVSN